MAYFGKLLQFSHNQPRAAGPNRTIWATQGRGLGPNGAVCVAPAAGQACLRNGDGASRRLNHHLSATQTAWLHHRSVHRAINPAQTPWLTVRSPSETWPTVSEDGGNTERGRPGCLQGGGGLPGGHVASKMGGTSWQRPEARTPGRAALQAPGVGVVGMEGPGAAGT